MKGRNLLFIAIIGCIAQCGAMAADDASTARAARRTTNGPAADIAATSRSKASTQSAQQSISARSTTRNNTATPAMRTTGARAGAIISDAARSGATSGARTLKTTGIQTRTTAPRTATSVPASRANIATRTATPTPQPASRPPISRAATTDTVTREQIIARDFNSCRQVYYECMDEFCANKDSQLKRCACSSRLHDFDKTKQQLAEVEDKLLDFNQRLLTVNMDKEDAAALFTATEGELAFAQKDTSASKKILDEITKKLNTNTSDSFNQNLSAISLSLNEDSAFDNIDSLMGADTAAKEGTALYNAALPICREMAAEVCDDADLAIAESGYQMTIEQDCNTVAKAYENQTTQAREKIREGGALLDISRLDTYQNHNSDDTLVCKKKMLDQLYDTSVCGAGLAKCLDISGQYIDPSTGQAFLTENLVNLETLITRPTDGEKWINMGTNDRFVSYLVSKKKFLDPATENCQDIADMVWDDFIEDALSQIKLAQDNKLEEVRQSCTSITTKCLSDTAQSLADFDARALSTFGILADKTVNQMCASVQNACTAVIDKDWGIGMSQIALNKTYDTVITTCREVGRACIIRSCKSISENFAMCESIDSTIRHRILNHEICWQEVKDCVAQADKGPMENLVNAIWGRCADDKIVIPDDGTETLMSWFAKNTGTETKSNSCTTKTTN